MKGHVEMFLNKPLPLDFDLWCFNDLQPCLRICFLTKDLLRATWQRVSAFSKTATPRFTLQRFLFS